MGSGTADDAVAAWEACHATPIEAEAHVVKGYLEHYGVPCVIDDARAPLQPLSFCAFGQLRVLVPAHWLPVARGLIAARDGRARRFAVRPRPEVATHGASRALRRIHGQDEN